MNKFLKSFFLTLVVIFSLASVFAANREISNVIIADIDVPYSNDRVLDTEASVPRNATYRITDVAWKVPANTSTGAYEVTVTLKANIGFIFSDKTTGTINGKDIISKKLIKDDEMSFTYSFEEDKSLIGTATSTTRYRISTYCDEEMGTITPYVIRVLKGNNQTVVITPKEGYKIKDVVVDGESVGIVSEYTFKKVKENHTLRAYFEEDVVDKVDENETNEKEPEGLKPLLTIILEIFKMFNI